MTILKELEVSAVRRTNQRNKTATMVWPFNKNEE